MHKFLFGLLSIVVSATMASAIVVPSKAKGIKGELVTAYATCTTPTTATNPPVVLPACTAVQLDTTCVFGSKGAGKYSASVSKTDIKVGATIGGLTGCDGATLTATSDADVTTTDCATGDCTASINDFPIGSCVVALGKCSIKTTVETFLGLGTQVFKEGQTLNIGLGETSIFRGGTKTFVGGVRVGPK